MKFIICLFSILFAFNLFANIDLDREYFKEIKINKDFDGENAFNGVVRQSPVGACQSFAMTAMLEYIYFFKTGKVIKFSEKYTAYKLLEYMVDTYQSEDGSYPEKPTLGSGDDNRMIDMIVNVGAMPNAHYPWGDNLKTDVPRQIDVEHLDKVFIDNPTKKYTKEEYLAELDNAFLWAAPKRFLYVEKRMSFSSGKTEEVKYRTPHDFSKVLNLKKEYFKLYYNKEIESDYYPMDPARNKRFVEYYSAQAKKFGILNQVATRKEMKEAIVESLNRHMVVGISAYVWMGDWGSRLVKEGGGGHGMIIVGFQTRGERVYFKLRNSWGTDKGINGYNFIEADLLLKSTLWIKTFRTI